VSQVLRHPATLLVVGAVLSGILIPTVTSSAQRRRTAYEVKLRLVEELTTEVASYLAALSRLMMMAHVSDSPERHTERWEAANRAASAWSVAAARMTTVIDAHFSRADLCNYLACLSDLLDGSFSMIYYTIDPRDDRVMAPEQYANLLQLGPRLNVDLSALPIELDEYFRRAQAPGPVGTMWEPLRSAGTQAASELAKRILDGDVVWLKGALRPRFPRGARRPPAPVAPGEHAP
jgi:hypothetical protein